MQYDVCTYFIDVQRKLGIIHETTDPIFVWENWQTIAPHLDIFCIINPHIVLKSISGGDAR